MSQSSSQSRKHSGATILLTVILVAVCVFLGSWQLQQGLHLATLTHLETDRMNQPPGALPDSVGKPVTFALMPVRTSGRYDHAAEVLLVERSLNGVTGAQVVTPLHLDDGSVVLVDRGWVPEDHRDSASRAEGLVAGEVTVTGFLMPSERRALFTNRNKPAADQWYWLDVKQIASRQGLANVRPYFIRAMAESGRVSVWPKAVPPQLNKPSAQSTYRGIALFAVGGLVVVVYLLRARRRRKAEVV